MNLGYFPTTVHGDGDREPVTVSVADGFVLVASRSVAENALRARRR
jgi:hypothetical protein